jgi:hypothetical protein
MIKKITWVLCILCAGFISGKTVLYSQAPAIDNFVLGFENNFEDDPLGHYSLSEYREDWNLSPTSTIDPQNMVDITVDADSRYNKVVRGFFPQGTLLIAEHGFFWDSPLVKQENELYFSYDIKFKPGFDWVKGGKLPGILGGKFVTGKIPTTTDGFSARMMWKEDGKLVFYVYHQDQPIIYGSTYVWENCALTSGKWYNITIRVVLNTITNGVAAKNGILEGFVDGKLMFQKKDVRFRSLESIKLDRMRVAAFFGGNTEDWACTNDEWIDTDNYVAYTYSSKAPNVPRGNQVSSSTTTLLHPYRNFGATTTTTTTIPAVPSALTSTTITSNSLSLKWNDNCSGEQGFKIEYRPDAASAFAEIATVTSNTISYTHSGLSANTLYHYRVCSYNTAGKSAYSPVLEATTLNNTTATGGLIARYTFESSVADVTGNGHNGTPVNGPTYSTQVKEGTRSLLFDGINDNVDIGTFNLGNQFTFASWVYIPSGLSNIRTIIANTISGATSNGFKIFVNSYSTSDRSIRVETGNGTQTGTTASAGSTFVFDQWNHIGVSMDKSSGKAIIYYNGVDVTATSKVAANFSTNGSTRLGIMSNSTYPFKGNFDDTRIYNKVLSASEIGALCISVPEPVTIPNAPGSLTATVNANSINLSWKDNSTNETGFRIERSLNSSSGFSLLLNGPANTTNFTDNSTATGIAYYYRIRAINASGESGNSNVISATVPFTLTSGLIAHYNYENSIADISGNGHNGTLVNGTTYSTQVKEGTRSLSFDGSNDYANLGTINHGNLFTFATWVYIPSGSSNIRTLIANTASGSTSNGFKVCINTYGTTDRKIILETGNGTQGAHTTSPASTFIYDRWNHIAVTVEKSTGKARIYYNGLDVTTTTPSIAPNFSTNSATRLGIMTNSNFPLRGKLDDTRIYNRVLTPSEISTLTSLPTLKSAEELVTTMSISNEEPVSVMVFPNPFTDYLHIKSNDIINSIEIYNLLGSKVYEQTGIESYELTVNQFSALNSIYIVRVILKNNQTHTVKVMHQE